MTRQNASIGTAGWFKRAKHGLYDSQYTQARFAREIGVNRFSVSNYFAGRLRYVSHHNRRLIRGKLVDLGILRSRDKIRIKPGRMGCAK